MTMSTCDRDHGCVWSCRAWPTRSSPSYRPYTASTPPSRR
jgi:hypothetical protein